MCYARQACQLQAPSKVSTTRLVRKSDQKVKEFSSGNKRGNELFSNCANENISFFEQNRDAHFRRILSSFFLSVVVAYRGGEFLLFQGFAARGVT